MNDTTNRDTLLYQGHGSLRIVTAGGKIIYIDPYAGKGYDMPADLILVSHGHSDHTGVGLIRKRAPGCREIWFGEALKNGVYGKYELGWVTVEAVQAGNNKNHDIRECVGWLLTFPDGVTVYASGDTSKTAQMAGLASRGIDYAFFCCDGIYNMDIPEASAPYLPLPGRILQLPLRAHTLPRPLRLRKGPRQTAGIKDVATTRSDL